MVRQRAYAPKTANRFREVIQRVFSWATSQRGVRLPNGVNPASSVERYKERAHTIRFLTLKQVNEQLDALAHDQQLQTMVAVFLFAGLRREEALWLTREDMNLKAEDHGMLHVRAKVANGEYWQPKTKKNRVVKISAALRHHLNKYEPPIVPGHWYFPSPKGFRWNPDNFSKRLARENHKAKLKWTCLDFRHTFASQLAQRGHSLDQIAKAMGNSPVICDKHYADFAYETLSLDYMPPITASM